MPVESRHIICLEVPSASTVGTWQAFAAVVTTPSMAASCLTIISADFTKALIAWHSGASPAADFARASARRLARQSLAETQRLVDLRAWPMEAGIQCAGIHSSVRSRIETLMSSSSTDPIMVQILANGRSAAVTLADPPVAASRMDLQSVVMAGRDTL